MAVERDIAALLGGLAHPDELQEDCLLNRVIRPNERCEYGRRHGFSAIRTIHDYQRSVPLVTYANIEPQSPRSASGEPLVLTSEPGPRFCETSGPTGAA